MKQFVKIMTTIFAIIGAATAFSILGVIVVLFTDRGATCADDIDRAYYREQRSEYNRLVKVADDYFSRGAESNFKQAFKHYLAANGLEDVNHETRVNYKLAYMYHYGLGVPQNDARAVRYYRNPLMNDYSGSESNVKSLAQKGNAEAQNLLGDFYDRKHQEEWAMTWYQNAADQGSVKANLSLGKMFSIKANLQKAIDGGDPRKDEETAAFYFQRAAQQGDEYAQDWLEKRSASEKMEFVP